MRLEVDWRALVWYCYLARPIGTALMEVLRMADIIHALAANTRFARLEEANRCASGPRAVGGSHRPAQRVTVGPRGLAADGDAWRAAWRIADGGIGNGSAYLAPSLGGWHWVAVLGSQDLGHSGAALLTIGPDGARYAQRYGSEPECWGDMEWIAAEAIEDRACATPAEFGAILEPAPVAEPVAILEPAPVAAMAAMMAAPVAAEPILEPAPAAAEPVARVGIWRRIRRAIVRQIDAALLPWAGGAWRDNLPCLVAAGELESNS